MIALIQRVRRASVTIDGSAVGAIGPGLLVLVCAEQGDTPAQADKLLAKVLKLRIFSDTQGKMNRCVQDLDGAGLHGGLLVVSQFTLAADTSGGNRRAKGRRRLVSVRCRCKQVPVGTRSRGHSKGDRERGARVEGQRAQCWLWCRCIKDTATSTAFRKNRGVGSRSYPCLVRRRVGGESRQ